MGWYSALMTALWVSMVALVTSAGERPYATLAFPVAVLAVAFDKRKARQARDLLRAHGG